MAQLDVLVNEMRELILERIESWREYYKSFYDSRFPISVTKDGTEIVIGATKKGRKHRGLIHISEIEDFGFIPDDMLVDLFEHVLRCSYKQM